LLIFTHNYTRDDYRLSRALQITRLILQSEGNVALFVVTVFVTASLFVTETTIAAEDDLKRANSQHVLPHFATPNSIHILDAEVQPTQFKHEANRQSPANPFVVAQVQEANPANLVQLNLGTEFELRALVEIVIDRLNLQITYDDKLLKKKVSIRTPQRIPSSSLWPLLNSVLRSEGLAIQESDIAGWKRIVSITGETGSRLPALVPLRNDVRQGDSQGTAFTQSFAIKHADAAELNEAIQPFLSQPGSSSLVVESQNVLIVTDFASNLDKVQQLIKKLDHIRPRGRIELVPVEHASAIDLADRLQKLLSAQSTMRTAGGFVSGKSEITVSVDERTNQLIFVGDPEVIADAKRLVKSLDISVQNVAKAYVLKHVSAEQADEVIGSFLGDDVGNPAFKSAVSPDSNRLLITGTPENHKRVEELIKALDVSVSREQSPVRFYKLENVTATGMMQTLRSLQGKSSQNQTLGFGGAAPIRGVSGGTRSPFFPGSNQPIGRPGSTGPFVPGANTPGTPGSLLPPPAGNDLLFRGQEPIGATPLSTPTAAQITADESSNTLIIVADPAVQRIYEELIRTLDRRRPQVLIEVTLVSIDISDDVSIGVEVSGGDRSGDSRLFAFSSFGLSTVDPVTGALSIIPGPGINGALVDPDVADVVLRAVASHERSRVLSKPKLLVNDNALGILTSVNEVPFSSINASNVVATTSFAGFAEAGTTIEVTPHISGDDYLQIEYRITMNSFTGAGAPGIPPPRMTDEIASSVTIPDGHTVIVGGLNQSSTSHERDGIPYLENIPLINRLSSLHTDRSSRSSLFVFLRPVILREEHFENLKYHSERSAKRARISGDFPRSQTILMR